MDTRFVQAHKEARWALGLTLSYLALPPVLPAFRAGLRWPAS